MFINGCSGIIYGGVSVDIIVEQSRYFPFLKGSLKDAK